MTGYDWISFTTDYGLSDGYVAACHGVIVRLTPTARVIDITHLVPPGDVSRGAEVLAQTVGHLPPAVHAAVVDPGVGTDRRGVALRTPGGLLVGPDNGLLLPAADALGGVTDAVDLTNPDWLAPQVSRTFHGRDVFAPVAARLASGAPLAQAGTALDPAALVRLPEPLVRIADDWVEAPVATVDHFGNVQLALAGSTLDRFGGTIRVARAGGSPAGDRTARRGGTFGDVPPGELVAHVDSAGRVALAVNGGRAADLLAVMVGDRLRLYRSTVGDHPDDTMD
ncbi:SAM-dependent chlorinase/fluorinase [Micromonospora sp. CPCC 206060]|uniref:SAM hydrolase/SAM-dependent halogenase family protein n=1 Tax=Micromonospora sp. CPCC 206060 TaxID=3122406 RepID=UPI002FEF7A8E